jgi:protein-tyrosine-phosphatase
MSAAAHFSRRAVVAGLAAAAALPSPALAMRQPRVLFICRFATVKSATARELLRKRARERGVGVKIRSRGITPVDHLPPAVRQRLIGQFEIDPAAEHAQTLQQADLDRADVVVLFDTLPPSLHKVDTLDWTDQPSLLEQFEPSMAYLEAHIAALLDWIAGKHA